MPTGDDLRRVAMTLDGTVENQHFDRAAFKVARIYVTLAPDGTTANFRFSPDEQEFKCLLAPNVFSPIPNAWGRQGWTTARLSEMTENDLVDALRTAWAHSLPKKKERRPRRTRP